MKLPPNLLLLSKSTSSHIRGACEKALLEGLLTVVTGKSLDSPVKGNVDKTSKKCPKNVQKCLEVNGGAENTIFGHFGQFGRCFCLVTLSNARPSPRFSLRSDRANVLSLKPNIGLPCKQKIAVNNFWVQESEIGEECRQFWT